MSSQTSLPEMTVFTAASGTALANIGHSAYNFAATSIYRYFEKHPKSIPLKPRKPLSKETLALQIFLEKYFLDPKDRVLRSAGSKSEAFFKNLALGKDNGNLEYKGQLVFNVESGKHDPAYTRFAQDLNAVLLENRASFFSMYQPFFTQPKLVAYSTVKFKLQDAIENNFLLEELFPVKSKKRRELYEKDFGNLMLADLMPQAYPRNKLLAQDEIALIRSWRHTHEKFKLTQKFVQVLADGYYLVKSVSDNLAKELLHILGLVNSSIDLLSAKITSAGSGGGDFDEDPPETQLEEETDKNVGYFRRFLNFLATSIKNLVWNFLSLVTRQGFHLAVFAVKKIFTLILQLVQLFVYAVGATILFIARNVFWATSFSIVLAYFYQSVKKQL